MHSWRVLLLPFLDQKKLYSQYNFDEPWDSARNRMLLEQRPAIYALHDRAQNGDSVTNYLAVVGQDTAWPGNGSVCIDDISDGTANTIIVVENIGSGIHWTEPDDLSFESMSFDLALSPSNGISSSYQPAAVLDASGNVRTLAPNELTPDQLRAMLTIAADDNYPHEDANTLNDGRNRPLRSDAQSP